jgi:hypothetical protein
MGFARGPQNFKWTFGCLFSAKKRKEREIFLNVGKTRALLSKGLFDTKLGHEKIEEILADTENQYRRYYIPKKGGGRREICEPSDELKKLQHGALKAVKVPAVSKYCTAYEKGMSVKLNAERHKKAKHILHIDIENFFPSINKEIFIKKYSPYFCNRCRDNCSHCLENNLLKLWKIVSFRGGLPIGSAASPFIANRIMTDIDEKLANLDKNSVYTRYADDMVFSSQKPIDERFIQKIEEIISAEGFKINRKKTYFMKSRKQVTGVLINKGKLSVGTFYKKRLKKDIYNYLVKDEGKAEVLKGQFSWLASIEPAYAKIIKNKYKTLDKKQFFK